MLQGEHIYLRTWSGDERWRLRWARVAEVYAGKRDELTTDRVYLELVLDSAESYLVDEEMEGFDSFAQQLALRLPSVLPYEVWWAEVAQPAFASDRILVYSRA